MKLCANLKFLLSTREISFPFSSVLFSSPLSNFQQFFRNKLLFTLNFSHNFLDFIWFCFGQPLSDGIVISDEVSKSRVEWKKVFQFRNDWLTTFEKFRVKKLFLALLWGCDKVRLTNTTLTVRCWNSITAQETWQENARSKPRSKHTEIC